MRNGLVARTCERCRGGGYDPPPPRQPPDRIRVVDRCGACGGSGVVTTPAPAAAGRRWVWTGGDGAPREGGTR